TVHAIARYRHYADHLEPIWDQLPKSIRGTLSVGEKPFRSGPGDVVMVAGPADIALAKGNQVIYVEHGAGQTYVDAPERIRHMYGGPFPSNVIGYIGPNIGKV